MAKAHLVTSTQVSAQLSLDAEVLRKLEQLANKRSCTVQQLLESLLAHAHQPADTVLGLLRDDADLLDTLVEDTMAARETQLLRAPCE